MMLVSLSLVALLSLGAASSPPRVATLTVRQALALASESSLAPAPSCRSPKRYLLLKRIGYPFAVSGSLASLGGFVAVEKAFCAGDCSNEEWRPLKRAGISIAVSLVVGAIGWVMVGTGVSNLKDIRDCENARTFGTAHMLGPSDAVALSTPMLPTPAPTYAPALGAGPNYLPPEAPRHR